MYFSFKIVVENKKYISFVTINYYIYFNQINTLADLGLLIRLGDGKLDNPKYKCSVNFECVNNIAR